MIGGNVYFAQVIDVLDNTTITARSCVGKAAFRCVTVPVAGVYSKPEVGDYGLVIKDQEIQFFIPIALPDTAMAEKIYYEFGGGATGILRSDGYFYVTKGGEMVLASGKSTAVNILKSGVGISSPSISLKTPGMSLSSSGNETDTSFSLSFFSGANKDQFFNMLAGDIDDWEKEIEDIGSGKYIDTVRNHPYAFYPLMSNILNFNLNTPTLAASTPTFNKHIKMYEDGRLAIATIYKTGTAAEIGLVAPDWVFPIESTQYKEDNTLGESFFKERTYSQNGFINITGGKDYHPNTENEFNSTDFVDLGIFPETLLGKELPISGDDKIDESNAKFLFNYNAEKIGYHLIKGVPAAGAGTWREVFTKYEITPGFDKKYSTSKIYITDTGVMVNIYIEMIIGALLNATLMPAALKATLVPSAMALKSASIKWTTFGADYKTRADDDIKRNSVQSGNLEVWWDEGDNPEARNWLYRAKGHCSIACNDGYVINGERYPTIATRQLISLDEPYGLHVGKRGMPKTGKGLRMSELVANEDRFIKKIRPDLEGTGILRPGSKPGQGRLPQVIKYDHYISQIKHNGISVETKRISNVSGECPVIDQNKFCPLPKTYKDGKVLTWDVMDQQNFWYRDTGLKVSTDSGFYVSLHEDEGNIAKISMVSKPYLEKELHNMKAVITAIGKYFINTFAPNIGSIYTTAQYKALGSVYSSDGAEGTWPYVPNILPLALTTSVYTKNLRGALSRKILKETNTIGQPPIPSYINWRVANGVDENSGLEVATVLTTLLSKLWSDKKSFYDYAFNSFTMSAPSFSINATTGENELFDKVRNSKPAPSGVVHPDYSKFTSVGFSVDKKVSEKFDIVNDPLDEEEQKLIDESTKKCFPDSEDTQLISYPGFNHMLGIMEKLKFKNINTGLDLLSKDVDDPGNVIKIVKNDGLLDLLDELFTVE
jgi:hypothetical protein